MTDTPTPRANPEATYQYCDPRGVLLYEVVRFPGKNFLQRRPDPQGDWVWDLQGVERVPYHLDEFSLVDQVYLVEGEKDVETLRDQGIVATTNSGGVNGWLPTLAKYFSGKHIIILPDQDRAGYAWAQRALSDLHGGAASLKRIDLPGLEFGSGSDVTDWFNAGHTKEELLAIVEAHEIWEPPGAAQTAWPDPLDEAALHGLAGEVVRAIEPHTEADPAGLLIQLLVCFGNTVGRSPHFFAEDSRHAMNLNAILVGATASGRKGSAWSRIRKLFGDADADWCRNRIKSGISSGEGLIYHVRDPEEKEEPIVEKGKTVGHRTSVVDRGIADKRLLVFESEFASPLRIMAREGNILSVVLRQAWDSGDLSILTKNSPMRATEAHISLVGHITKTELLVNLSNTDVASGLANRIMWICVRRSKCLPWGGNFHGEKFKELADRVRQALEFARNVGEMGMDQEARTVWENVYRALTREEPGLFGAFLVRAAPTVRRLAMIYALMNHSGIVRAVHLRAALAVWEYAEASARFIFGSSFGDPTADAILSALHNSPDGMTRMEIRDLFGKHKSAAELDRALSLLVESGLVRKDKKKTRGRSAEKWFESATEATEG